LQLKTETTIFDYANLNVTKFRIGENRYAYHRPVQENHCAAASVVHEDLQGVRGTKCAYGYEVQKVQKQESAVEETGTRPLAPLRLRFAVFLALNMVG